MTSDPQTEQDELAVARAIAEKVDEAVKLVTEFDHVRQGRERFERWADHVDSLHASRSFAWRLVHDIADLRPPRLVAQQEAK